jgi:hypothetical protein
VPADVEGEITGIAFAVAAVGTEDANYSSLRLDFNAFCDGVIHQGSSGHCGLDANHVLMHFLVPVSFKHMLVKDHLRVWFHWRDASKSNFFKSFGFHLIRRYEEKMIETWNPIGSNTKGGIVQPCDLENRNYTNPSVIIM